MEVRNVSIPELAEAVAALPEVVREELAKGPLPLWGCRVCKALRVGGMRDESDLDGASRVLCQWHEDQEVIIGRGITDSFIDGDPTERELEAITGRLEKEPKGGDVAYTYAGAISYYRLCIAYLLAGWRPEPVNGLAVGEVALDEAADVDTQQATRDNPSPAGAVTPRGASGRPPSSANEGVSGARAGLLDGCLPDAGAKLMLPGTSEKGRGHSCA